MLLNYIQKIFKTLHCFMDNIFLKRKFVKDLLFPEFLLKWKLRIARFNFYQIIFIEHNKTMTEMEIHREGSGEHEVQVMINFIS